MRTFVTIEIGAKNEVFDPVYQLSCLPSWSKPLSYRKLPTFYSGPEGARVKVSPLLFFLIISCVLDFLNFARLQSPKLGLSLGTKVKTLLHHIDSRCVRAELEDIDQERLDIDVFWRFFY